MRTVNNIGFAILELREGLQYTQKDLAVILRLPPAQISHWECGRRIPSVENLIKLAEALRCTLDDLVS